MRGAFWKNHLQIKKQMFPKMYFLYEIKLKSNFKTCTYVLFEIGTQIESLQGEVHTQYQINS